MNILKQILTILLFFQITVLNAQNIPSYFPTNGLAGWWPFTGNAIDSSGNGNNGTLFGPSPGIDRFSYAGRSYYFDGVDDLIDFGNSISVQDDFSISFWIRIDTIINYSATNYPIILSKFDSVSNSGWSIGINGGNIVYAEGCANGCSVNRTVNVTSLPLRQWHNVGMRRLIDGRIIFYINGGISIINTTLSPGFSNQSASLIAGYKNVRYTDTASYFRGYLDDVVIWDTIVNPSVFSDIYANGNCGSSATIEPKNEAYIHGNKIKAIVRNGGDLWWDGQRAQFMPEYDSTLTNNPSTLFAGGVWLGAYDGGGDLCLAAQTYRQRGNDFWAGPLDSNANVLIDQHCMLNKIWGVNYNEILTHLQNFQDSGYLMSYASPNILFWPGRNNPHYFLEYGYSLPLNENFAPFFDANNDGNYNPLDGDYPVFNSNDPSTIPSDMKFTIFNDNGNIHTNTNGKPLKAEIHLTLWSLNCTNDNILNKTIFTRHTIISKNNQNLRDVRFAMWHDPDLGCYIDDYLGTSRANNAVYFYNADANDDPICGGDALGFGLKPPVQSVMFLNRPLNASTYLDSSNDPVRGNPGSATQHYRLMDGKWLDGRPVSYGGTGDNGTAAPSYPFVYDGLPTDFGSSSWTMANQAVAGADYRSVISTYIDSLLPFRPIDIDMAYVTHRDTTLADNIQMTALVNAELPLVQNWYNQGFPSSCQYRTSGWVYQDNNQNCMMNANESGIAGIRLIIQPGNMVVVTNQVGYWSLELPTGSYTITVDTTHLNWDNTCALTQSFTVTSPFVSVQAPNFGLTRIPCAVPNVSITMPTIRRGFSNQRIYVQACNAVTATGRLDSAHTIVTLPSQITLQSASRTFTSLGNNRYRFYLGNLNPGQCVNFTINATVTTQAVNGQTLCMNAELFPQADCVFDSIPTPYDDSPSGSVTPCTLPWDRSSLRVEGECVGDSVRFVIYNTGVFGGGDMDCFAPVRIYVDGQWVMLDSIRINGGDSVVFMFAGTGGTIRLEADQHPLHPGNSRPNANVENCGNGTWTPGIINTMPQDDADPIVDIYCGQVTAPYDPNDKTGFPLGVGTNHNIRQNQQIEYLIRFQNIGSDTAFNVVIRDTLTTDLNIFTVQSGVSSHPYEFRMYGPRVLEWKFNNIMLPDSNTNEPASNGFVKFTVEQNPDLPFGTVIENSAAIYFDFEAPVITNTYFHTIHDFSINVSVEPIEGIDRFVDVKVIPNPFSNTAQLKLEGLENTENLELEIFNLSGQRMQFLNNSQNGQFQLSKGEMSQGIYFFSVHQNGKVVARGKMVVE